MYDSASAAPPGPAGPPSEPGSPAMSGVACFMTATSEKAEISSAMRQPSRDVSR